jgi:hypothetical protein
LLILAAPAAGQDAFLERWRAAAKANPPDVRFEISLPADKTAWWMGETIPLELKLSSTAAKKWRADLRMYDRIGRLNYSDEFHIDRQQDIRDPLEGTPAGSGGMGGISGAPILLTEEPFQFERDLNEWVRFLQPGTYRLYVLTRRVYPDKKPDVDEPGLGRGSTTIASNIVRFEVSGPPERWAEQQIEEAEALLDAPHSVVDDGASQSRGARMLRFLDTPQAVEVMTRRLGSTQSQLAFQLFLGIVGSPHRARALPLLEKLLEEPSQPITPLVIQTMTQLWGLTQLEPMPPFPESEQEREPWRVESARRWKLQQQKGDEYLGKLAAALAAKAPEPRAICIKALLDNSNPLSGEPPPAWRDRVVAAVPASFAELPAIEQSNLLDWGWHSIANRAMLPVLRKVYENPPEPRRDPPIQDLALRRIHQLDPAEGRALILEQIRNPTRGLSLFSLMRLEDESLPELNDIFIQRLQGDYYEEPLLLRYADGAILPRVKAVYERREKGREARGEPPRLNLLHLYLLRQDAAYGEREVRKVFAGDQPPAPGCCALDSLMRELGRYAWSPALEKVAIDLLDSGWVVVKQGAAEVLGRFGSAGAEKPLWNTMEVFRQWWQGREQELVGPPGQEGIQFERTLRTALAQASGWVLSREGLTRLRSLCSSDWCRSDVDEWLRVAQQPMHLQIRSVGADYVFVSAGPYELRSTEEVRRKFSQFPPGTSFVWESRPGQYHPAEFQRVRDEVEELVNSHGLTLVPAAEPR